MNNDRSPVPLLTYEQLAGWLNDSVRHLRRLVDEQRIPYHKVGHFVRFDEAEIMDWLAANHHGHSPKSSLQSLEGQYGTTTSRPGPKHRHRSA